MLASGGDDADIAYYLDNIRTMPPNSVWVYERKNVLEIGYWYLHMFDKKNKKVFFTPLESVYHKLKLVENYSIRNFQAEVLLMAKNYYTDKPDPNLELRQHASQFLSAWEIYFNLVASKWPDSVAIDLTNSKKAVSGSDVLKQRAFTDMRDKNSFDTSRQDAAEWSKIMENYMTTSSMNTPLHNDSTSSKAEMSEKSVQDATVEWSILEPLIAEALELLIRTDDAGLFYEDVPHKTTWDRSKVIGSPMTLGRMHMKWEAHAYKNLSEFNADVDLMVSNCLQCYEASHHHSQAVRELHSVWCAKWKALRSRLPPTANTAKTAKLTASRNEIAAGEVSFSPGQTGAASSSKHTTPETFFSLVAEPAATSMAPTIAGPSSVCAQSPAPALTPSKSESAPSSVTKIDPKALLLQNMRDIDVDSIEHLLFRMLDIGLSFLRLVDKNKLFETHDSKRTMSLSVIEDKILNNDDYSLRACHDDINLIVDECRAAHPSNLALMQESFALLAGWKEYHKEVNFAWPILAYATTSGVAKTAAPSLPVKQSLQTEDTSSVGSSGSSENSPRKAGSPVRSLARPSSPPSPSDSSISSTSSTSSTSSASSVSSASTLVLPLSPTGKPTPTSPPTAPTPAPAPAPPALAAAPAAVAALSLTTSTSSSKKRVDHPSPVSASVKKSKCTADEGQDTADTPVQVPLHLQVDILKFLVHHGIQGQHAMDEFLATIRKSR